MIEIRHWLDEFKPLWEFLTAVGTVGAVIVSLWLAFRGTPTKVKVSAELREFGASGQVCAELVATNKEAGRPVLDRFYWRLAGVPGRVNLIQGGDYNGTRGTALPQRLEKGDRFSVLTTINDLLELALPAIPELDEAGLRRCVMGSKFGCVTTEGDQFEAKGSPELLNRLAQRLVTMRTNLTTGRVAG